MWFPLINTNKLLTLCQVLPLGDLVEQLVEAFIVLRQALRGKERRFPVMNENTRGVVRVNQGSRATESWSCKFTWHMSVWMSLWPATFTSPFHSLQHAGIDYIAAFILSTLQRKQDRIYVEQTYMIQKLMGELVGLLRYGLFPAHTKKSNLGASSNCEAASPSRAVCRVVVVYLADMLELRLWLSSWISCRASSRLRLCLDFLLPNLLPPFLAPSRELSPGSRRKSVNTDDP